MFHITYRRSCGPAAYELTSSLSITMASIAFIGRQSAYCILSQSSVDITTFHTSKQTFCTLPSPISFENADKTPGKSPVANGQSPFRLEKPETWTPILSSLSAMDLHCSYCIRLVPHTYTFHRAAPGVNRRQPDLIGLTHSHFQV